MKLINYTSLPGLLGAVVLATGLILSTGCTTVEQKAPQPLTQSSMTTTQQTTARSPAGSGGTESRTILGQ